MSHYYEVGCIDEKAFVCDNCEIDDGRPTLNWQEKDFALCFECLTALAIKHIEVVESVDVKRASIKEDLRNFVFDRDGNKCVRCMSQENLCVDHKIPFWGGGRTEPDNLQTLCRSCNSRKGKKNG